MKFYIRLFTLLLISGLGLVSCTSDELAFDIVESPVLAVFDTPGATPDSLSVLATFYDLDKSGILDLTIGIDSLPIADLEIKVYVDESTLVQTLTTDSQGQILFETPLSALGVSSRLEWVGIFDETPFRIYQNF